MGVLSPADAAALQAKGLINPQTAAQFGPAATPTASSAPGLPASQYAGIDSRDYGKLNATIPQAGLADGLGRLLGVGETEGFQNNVAKYEATQRALKEQNANTGAAIDAGARDNPSFGVLATPDGRSPINPNKAADIDKASRAGTPLPSSVAGSAPLHLASEPEPELRVGGGPGGSGGGKPMQDPRLAGLERDKQLGEQEIRNIGQQRVNAQDAADAEFQSREAYQTRMQANDFAAQQKRDAEAASIDKQVGTIKGAVDDYKNSKVDGAKYWKDAGVLGSILGVLGAAIGGGLAARTGGPNQALAFMERQIDKNIRQQESAIDRKGKNAEMQRSLLGDMRNVTQSNEAARQAARQKIYGDMIDNLETMKAKNKGPEAQAKADAMIGDIQAKMSAAQTGVQTTLMKEHQARAAAGAAQQYAHHRDDVKDQQTTAEIRIKATEAGAKANENGGGSVPVFGQDGQPMRDASGAVVTTRALSKDDAIKLKDSGEAYADMKQGLERLKNLRTEFGHETFNTQGAESMKSVAAGLRLRLKDLQKLGALSGSDYDMLDSQIPKDPSSNWTDGSVINTLNEVGRRVDASYQNSLDQRTKGAPNVTQNRQSQNLGFTGKK